MTLVNKDGKKINCLELKEQVQAEMWAEFEANRDQFSTYDDYLNFRMQNPRSAQLAAIFERFKKAAEAKNTVGCH